MKFFSIFLFLFNLNATVVFAQSEQDSKQFFEKDFANSVPALETVAPIGQGKITNIVPLSPKSAIGIKQDNTAEISNLFDTPTAPTIAPTNTVLLTALPQKTQAIVANADLPSEEVFAIGAVFNAIDKEHLALNFKELKIFSEKHKIELGPIYLLGAKNDFKDPKAIDDLKSPERLGIPLNLFVKNIPNDLQIIMSPAWIVYTEKGRVILENLSPFSRYFNADGRLVISKK